MALYAAIALEGVIAKEVGGKLTTPIKHGHGLYNSLNRVYKLALLSNDTSRDYVEHWCAVNQVNDWTQIVLGGPDAGRAQQLELLRTSGYAVEMYIDSDPAAVAEGLRLGITSLLFASPAYSRPEFRPDEKRGVRAWADIAAEVESQNSMKKSEPARTADVGVEA
jgi:hypothetical protein